MFGSDFPQIQTFRGGLRNALKCPASVLKARLGQNETGEDAFITTKVAKSTDRK